MLDGLVLFYKVNPTWFFLVFFSIYLFIYRSLLKVVQHMPTSAWKDSPSSPAKEIGLLLPYTKERMQDIGRPMFNRRLAYYSLLMMQCTK